MISNVIGQLFEDDLPLLRLILPAGGLPVKHRFSVREQRGQLIFKLHDMPAGFAKPLPFTGDAILQPGPLLIQLRRGRVHGEPDGPVPGVKIRHVHAQDRREKNLGHRLAGHGNDIDPFRAGRIEAARRGPDVDGASNTVSEAIWSLMPLDNDG